jgi:fructose-specific phosphotransferase system component IIB
LIASIYGRLVKECLEKGYTEREITIKIEEPGETRTEKYLEKSEISRELSTIGKEGEELATLLRVKEA